MVWHLLSVWIQKDKLILDLLEDECVLVLKDGLIREHLEYLLQCGLTDAVLLNTERLLHFLKLAK